MGEDLEGDLVGDLVGDLEVGFGDGGVREAEKEFRDERISGLFFSVFSLSLSFLKMWVSWTIGGGEGLFFFFFLIEGGRIGEISRYEPRMGEGLGNIKFGLLQLFNVAKDLTDIRFKSASHFLISDILIYQKILEKKKLIAFGKVLDAGVKTRPRNPSGMSSYNIIFFFYSIILSHPFLLAGN